MAPLKLHSPLTKLLPVYLLSLLFITSTLTSCHPQSHDLLVSRRMLQLEDVEEDDQPIIIKKKATSNPTTSHTPKNISTKNQTKPIKPSSKNQTKLSKPKNTPPFKNQTTKPTTKSPPLDSLKTTNKTKLPKTNSTSFAKSHLKKLNSTSKSTTKVATLPGKKNLSDLAKPLSSKNKTTELKPKGPIKTKAQPNKAQKQPTWIPEDEQDEDNDFVSEFRDLPLRFQETFVPDLEKFSKTSQIYLTKYNKEFTKGFKPYVGSKYASTIASIVSFATIIIPLIFVSLIFNKIKAYFSIQKLLIFIQIYLSIYFTILALSTLITGLEPLKYFYTASHSTYVCVQVLQSLAYVLYLLLLLMYLVLVFSTETGLFSKLLGLAQTIVGFAVGLHYYITVFHREVLHQPPKSSWKVHSLYATCFVVICLLGRMDRRKKAYLQEGGDDGKKS